MGIIKTIYPNKNSIVIIWKINESLSALQNMTKEKSNIKNIIKRKEFYASRILIENLCKSFNIRYYGIIKNDSGKPYLKNRTENISISHSFPYVAGILNEEKKCGIDIEKIQKKILKINHKFLSKSELNKVKKNTKKNTIYWTAKESLYKLKGEFLSFKNDIKIIELKNSFNIYGKILSKKILLNVEEIDGYIITYTN
ncbi:MAG TPA: 4'-phosphopantetheinyl transferase superfamily protein [Cytophagales bacterium]|jgi:phosphopantetheinyl transferase|nr:4'-phosphopantetheinyl transferase superfamily protein [Cytophagales bacterium]